MSGLRDAMVGKTISHYRILEKLGSGGMGVVYKALDLTLERYVALKFLPPELVRDPVAMERLQREARAASALDNPNICTIYEIGEYEGDRFIAMQFLEGRPLSSVVAEGPIKMAKVADIGTQIAEALDAAHSRGIVHRDIKPANIFLTARGQVKVLDFGLAKATTARITVFEGVTAASATLDSDAMLTSPGSTVGTVSYMSPEQACGDELDQRSDLFSFGVLLYEMSTGRLPFEGKTPAMVYNSILSHQPKAPSQLNPQLSPELDRIVLKALEKDREVRYQSAAEMRSDLLRLRRDATSANIGSEAAAARHIARRRRMIPAIVIAAAIAIAALLGVSLWQWRGRTASAGTGREMAVVEIENLSGDKSLDWLGNGVVELLTANLAQAKGLDVIPSERLRGIARGYAGSDGSISPDKAQSVAHDANADMFLSGALLRIGPRLRLDLRVQNTDSGKLIWADKVEGESPQAVFAMVDQATNGIISEVAPKQSVKFDAAASLTSNLEALHAYEQGNQYLDRVMFPQAAEAYRRAVQLDPQFSLAYARLGMMLEAMQDFAGGRQMAQTAAHLADRQQLPKQVKILVQAQALAFDGRIEECTRLLESGKAEFPRDTALLESLGEMYTMQNRFADARDISEQSLKIDPHQPVVLNTLSYAYARLGNLPEALRTVGQYAAMLPPNDPNPMDTRGDDYCINKHFDEGIVQYQKNLQLNPNWQGSTEKIALANLHAGRYDLAESSLRAHYEVSKGLERAIDASVLGDIEVGRGQFDKAIKDYQEASQLIDDNHIPEDFAVIKTGELYTAMHDPKAGLAAIKDRKSLMAMMVRAVLYGQAGDSSAMEREIAATNQRMTRFGGEYMAASTEALIRALVAGIRNDSTTLFAESPKVGVLHRDALSLEMGKMDLRASNLPKAEAEFQHVLDTQGSWAGPGLALINHDFFQYEMAQFSMAQVRERQGRTDEARGLYQDFLSHFTGSPVRLPQLAEARDSLQKLQQVAKK
jgi:eukaryotic-like serine/threonine-protein kinase